MLAQHDHGIPTWQDVADLAHEPTLEELRRVLRDPTTANAVIWVTPEVKQSPTICKLEAVEAHRRWEAGDGFFIVPVAAGGLHYEPAADIVSEFLGIRSFRQWNFEKAQGDPIGEEEAARVAHAVLARRLGRIHHVRDRDERVLLELYTRRKAPFLAGTAICLDWAERFEDRAAKAGAWDQHLLPALYEVHQRVAEKMPGRSIVAGGHASQVAAMALGAAFPTSAGIPLSWRQHTSGRPDQEWSLNVAPTTSAVEIRTTEDDLDSTGLAVIIGFNHDVEASVAASRANLPNLRGYVIVTGRNGGNCDLRSPGEAVDAVRQTMDAIGKCRREWRDIKRIHVFLDAPSGFAMMLGQRLNACGPVQTYDHIDDGAIGHYRPAALLHAGLRPRGAAAPSSRATTSSSPPPAKTPNARTPWRRWLEGGALVAVAVAAPTVLLALKVVKGAAPIVALIAGAALVLVLGVMRAVGEKRGNSVLGAAGFILAVVGMAWSLINDQ